MRFFCGSLLVVLFTVGCGENKSSNLPKYEWSYPKATVPTFEMPTTKYKPSLTPGSTLSAKLALAESKLAAVGCRFTSGILDKTITLNCATPTRDENPFQEFRNVRAHLLKREKDLGEFIAVGKSEKSLTLLEQTKIDLAVNAVSQIKEKLPKVEQARLNMYANAKKSLLGNLAELKKAEDQYKAVHDASVEMDRVGFDFTKAGDSYSINFERVGEGVQKPENVARLADYAKSVRDFEKNTDLSMFSLSRDFELKGFRITNDLSEDQTERLYHYFVMVSQRSGDITSKGLSEVTDLRRRAMSAGNMAFLLANEKLVRDFYATQRSLKSAGIGFALGARSGTVKFFLSAGFAKRNYKGLTRAQLLEKVGTLRAHLSDLSKAKYIDVSFDFAFYVNGLGPVADALHAKLTAHAEGNIDIVSLSSIALGSLRQSSKELGEESGGTLEQRQTRLVDYCNALRYERAWLELGQKDFEGHQIAVDIVEKSELFKDYLKTMAQERGETIEEARDRMTAPVGIDDTSIIEPPPVREEDIPLLFDDVRTT